MNRVEHAIEVVGARLDETAKTVQGRHDIKQLSRKFDIDMEEYVAHQEMKSVSQAEGKISQDEAMTIYAALGSGPTAFNGKPLAVKMVVIKFLLDLYGQRVAERNAKEGR